MKNGDFPDCIKKQQPSIFITQIYDRELFDVTNKPEGLNTHPIRLYKFVIIPILTLNDTHHLTLGLE